MLSLWTGAGVGLHVAVKGWPAPGSTFPYPFGKVVSVAKTVSTAERPCEPSALCLYSSLAEHPANPALPHPALLDFCEQLPLLWGPTKKIIFQFSSAELSSAQFSLSLVTALRYICVNESCSANERAEAVGKRAQWSAGWEGVEPEGERDHIVMLEGSNETRSAAVLTVSTLISLNTDDYLLIPKGKKVKTIMTMRHIC